jgi:precorrin-6B methylase 2
MAKSWSEKEIMGLMSGFQPACVLAAAAELDVFSVLATKAMTGAEFSDACGTDARATRIVLDALVALDLLAKRGDAYSVVEGATFLTGQGERSVLPMVQHLANCLRSWSHLARVVQTGHPAERGPSIRGEQGDLESFIGAMNAFTAPDVDPVIARLDLTDCCHVLDIGGASGNWTLGFLRAHPQARATLFDLPDVIPLAQQRLEQAGMMDRLELVAGDYNTDDLPVGADLAWLSAIVHQNSRSQNRALYARIYAALADQGTLMIRDVVMDSTRTQPQAGALFAVNMLVNTPGGDTFTLEEYEEDLRAAGFHDIEQVYQDEWMNSLVRAMKHV